jgi:hypothetical protein
MKIQIRLPAYPQRNSQPGIVSIQVNTPPHKVQVEIDTDELWAFPSECAKLIELEVLMRPA